MASRQQIKRRIGSVKSTKQITRAMQLVAASKLRKAQDAVARPREFSRMARELLTRLRQVAADDSELKLFTKRPVKKRLLIVMSSDRGLAGAYNSNIVRKFVAELRQDQEAGVETIVMCVGRQIANTASRVKDITVHSVYQDLPDNIDANYLRPILNTAVELFATHEVDAVDVVCTHFVSSLRQEVRVQRLLPAGFDEEVVSDEVAAAELEPSAEALLRSTTMRLLEVQLYQGLLDAVASEQSMRMIAMKNATDNATDLMEDLTLAFNTARQAAITQELAEISSGAEAMK
jgi:F-type H+-transporting ATPase subunit gamma